MTEKIFHVEDPKDYPSGLLRMSGGDRELADLYVVGGELTELAESNDPPTAKWAAEASPTVRDAINRHEAQLALPPPVPTDKK